MSQGHNGEVSFGAGMAAPVLALLTAGLMAAAPTAEAKPAKTTNEVEVSDAMKAAMVVFVTPDGSYIALWPGEGKKQVFHGDGRTLHRQRVLISAVDEDDNLSVLIWSPEHPRDAALESRDDKWFLRCGTRRVGLSMVDAAERRLLLRTARFREERFQRTPYALARNNRGEYVYVDRQTNARGTRGFRLFVGRAGRVKPQRLKWVVSDSEGDVFSSKAGQLRITSGDKGGTRLVWRRGKRTQDLLSVPISQNSYLIYKELGVYENQSFGTPCDSH